MITGLIAIIFILGYAAIALESFHQINKSATALLMGVVCWAIYITGGHNEHIVNGELLEQMGQISSILFFLLGAMTIVELIEAHNGFSVITSRITTTNKGTLLLVVTLFSFFLSALLDNLTTTILMLSLVRKMLYDRTDRRYFAGMIIIAANAGGAWSPLGDVTTTMLWIGGQISASSIIVRLIVPSLLCALVPALILWGRFRRATFVNITDTPEDGIKQRERKIIFYTGMLALLFVPLLKVYAHLPPFMGMMLSLATIWIVESLLHRSKEETLRRNYSVVAALGKIDTTSILFFLGILLTVGALEAVGLLTQVSGWLNVHLHNLSITGITLGLISAIVDNVPLMAAAQGMYPLQTYPMDHFLWELLAFSTGTGGSIIIIGSAAGVAAMGVEEISFIWYLKKISWLALLGFAAGIAVYLVIAGIWVP